MKKFMLAAAFLGALTIPALASAQTIKGAAVINGVDYFDPANGLVLPAFGNANGTTVAIGPGIEFGLADTISGIVVNIDTADFTSNSLLITDVSGVGAFAVQYRFTASTSGFFNNLQLVTDSFGGTYSLVGDTLTFNAPQLITPGTYSARFTFAGAAPTVPEPATWAMMMLGFGMVGFRLRRGAGKVSTRLAYA